MLEPLSAGALLDEAARTYQAIGGPILRLSALPLALAYGVVTFFGVFVAPGIFYTANPNSLETQAVEVVAVIAIGLGVAAPLFLLCVSYVAGLVSRLVADLRLGNRPDEVEALAAARRGLRSMVGAGLRTVLYGFGTLAVALLLLLLSAWVSTQKDPLLALLASIVGLIGLVVGPFWAAIVASLHSLAPSVVVVEELAPRDALRRSAQLLQARGRQPSGYGTLLGVWGLIALVWLAVGSGVGIVLSAFDLGRHLQGLLGAGVLTQVVDRAIQMLPGFLALWVTVPLWCACTTLLYYDRRVRLEGFDVEVLAREMVRRSRESRFQL